MPSRSNGHSALDITERTHAQMAVAYQAGASGLPCGLMRSLRRYRP